MARPKKTNTRDVVLRVRFTGAEWEKIKRASTAKTASEIIRFSALRGAEIAEADIRETTSLLSKLENADLSKIAEKADIILEKLSSQSSQNGEGIHEIFKKLEQEIGVLKTVVAVVAMGLPAPSKDLEKYLPAIHKKLKSVLRKE